MVNRLVVEMEIGFVMITKRWDMESWSMEIGMEIEMEMEMGMGDGDGDGN